MQLDVSIILIEAAKFCTLLSIGFIAIKAGIFSNENLKTLSAFALKIALPAMLVTKLPASTTRTMLLHALPLLMILPLWYAVLAIGGALTAKWCKMPPNTARVHMVQYIMGNIGVMGMILIIATLGDGSAIYMSAILFADQCLMWTVCETLSYPVEQQRQLKLSSLKKVLTIPTIMAFLIAIVMIALDWHPDNLIMDVLADVGSTAKSIAMIFIGGTLATLNFKRLPYINGMLAIITTKMVLLPLLIYWATGWLNNFLDPMARMALTLTTALPCLFSMAILARNNGTDYEYATLAVFGSTMASMVTIPLVSCLVNLMP